MFIENKYSRIYLSMMKRAQNREPVSEGENHHIEPRSCGGDNSSANIVRLTHREHFIAHALLTKIMIEPEHRRSMAYAFFCLSNRRGKRINSKLYDVIKRQIIHHMQGSNNHFYGLGHTRTGELNHFYGKRHSAKTIETMKERLSERFSGVGNPFYGKKHSSNTKRQIAERRIIPIEVSFTNGEIIRFDRREELGVYLGVSRSMGAQLAKLPTIKGNKCHVWPKYGIINVRYMEKSNETSVDQEIRTKDGCRN